MKQFGCGICKKNKIEFRGDRKTIREHLRKVHDLRGIKTGKKELFIKRTSSDLNKYIIEYDWV